MYHVTPPTSCVKLDDDDDDDDADDVWKQQKYYKLN